MTDLEPSSTVKALQSGRIRNSDLAALLYEGFSDNPLWVAVFPGERRKSLLPWLFERRVQLWPEWSTVGLADGIVWHYALLPFDAPAHSPSLWRLLQLGLIQLPFRCKSPARFFALQRMMSKLRAGVKAVLPGPHDCLEAVVTRRSSRGKGIMSRVLADRLNRQRRPVVLYTQDLRNVRFYESLGFHFAIEEQIEIGGSAFRNWTLIRYPVSNPISIDLP